MEQELTEKERLEQTEAMIEALIEALIKKGLITEEEYEEALNNQYELED